MTEYRYRVLKRYSDDYISYLRSRKDLVDIIGGLFPLLPWDAEYKRDGTGFSTIGAAKSCINACKKYDKYFYPNYDRSVTLEKWAEFKIQRQPISTEWEDV